MGNTLGSALRLGWVLGASDGMALAQVSQHMSNTEWYEQRTTGSFLIAH